MPPNSYGLGYLRGGYGPLVVETEPEVAELVFQPTPDQSVEIDFVHDFNVDGPLPDPTWTEVASLVQAPGGVRTKRGRQRLLDRVEAGTATFVFNDEDGLLDPDNEESPFYPGVVPNRRIRHTAVITEDEFDPFTTGSSFTGDDDVVGGGALQTRVTTFDGLIDGFRYEYPVNGRHGVVTVEAVDWLGVLARETVDWNMFVVGGDVLPNPERYGPDALHTLLDLVPFASRRLWPNERQADSIRIKNETLNDANANQTAQRIALAEGGNFFATRDGFFQYFGPSYELRPPDEGLRFGEGFMEFVDVEFVFDMGNVANSIQVAELGLFEDDASIRRNGLARLTLDVPIELAGDAAARAEGLLTRIGEPRKVIIRLDLSDVVEDWPLILSADLWTKILLRVRLHYSDSAGDPVVREQISLVEGIEINTSRRPRWGVVWWLSVAPFPNLVPAASADFEDATDPTGGWTAGDANTTLSQSDPDFQEDKTHGGHALVLSASADGTVSAFSPAIDGIQGRSTYRARLNWRTSDPEHEAESRLELDWLGTAGNVLSTIIGDTVPLDVGIISIILRRRRWASASVSGRAPTGAVAARIRFVADNVLQTTDSRGATLIDEVELRRTG